MAIVKLKPEVPNIKQTLPEAVDKTKKSNFNDLMPYTKVVSLLKYVEGYPWQIHYYGQILNENNTLTTFDPSSPNLTQPYYEVKNLILQVSSPLSSSYDQETGITTITGSALTPYGLKPNVGDIFIANVDNSEDAIFIVVSVERKTHRKTTIYEISYNLLGYVSQEQNLITTLQEKVQETYYFNKDANYFNRDYLITPEVKEIRDRLKRIYAESVTYYLDMFCQKKHGALFIPSLEDKVYDHYLVDFITKVINRDILSEYPLFSYSTLNTYHRVNKTIYHALIERNRNKLPLISKKMVYVPTYTIPNNSRFGTLFHAKVDYITFPLDYNDNVLIGDNEIELTSFEELYNVKNDKNYWVLPDKITLTSNNDNIYELDLLHELFVDNYYVVSENFYRYMAGEQVPISYAEYLIAKYMKNIAISKRDILVGVQNYLNWGYLHQLYLLPIYWLLINVYF